VKVPATETIISIFCEVHDPRDVNARHPLSSMLFIALAATLCGAKSVVDIADFGEDHEPTLAEIVDLPHGVPSHDCFSRVFRLLAPAELESALTRCAQALRAVLGLGAPRGVVAVDAKSLRHGYERGRACMPPLMVGVWDAETRLSIAAPRAAGGDEAGATLAVLKSLALKDCIVTADALHCHPRLAAGVRAAGAHYAPGLKGNHGPLIAPPWPPLRKPMRQAKQPSTSRARGAMIVTSGGGSASHAECAVSAVTDRPVLAGRELTVR
jgi:hypothetical protein